MTPLEAIEAKLATRRGLPPPKLRQALRRDLGLSQEDLAAALNVHRETVSRWERGVNVPRGQNLTDYVAILTRLRTGYAA